MTGADVETLVGKGKSNKRKNSTAQAYYVVKARKSNDDGRWRVRAQRFYMDKNLVDLTNQISDKPAEDTELPEHPDSDTMTELSYNASIVFGKTEVDQGSDTVSDLGLPGSDLHSAAFQSALSNLRASELHSTVSSRSRSSYLTAQSGMGPNRVRIASDQRLSE
jgi:hypothetical protein